MTACVRVPGAGGVVSPGRVSDSEACRKLWAIVESETERDQQAKDNADYQRAQQC